MEALEVDIADVEGRVHAGPEQREIDGPKLALDLGDDRLELIGIEHVGRVRLDVGVGGGERIELFAWARGGGNRHAGGAKPLGDLAAYRPGRAGDPRHLPGICVRHRRRP